MKLFVCVMGMVMIVEGLPYFAFPEKMKEVLKMVMGLENSSLRMFGFFLMVLGLVIVYVSMGQT